MQGAERLMHLMAGFAIGQQRLQSGCQRPLALILQQLLTSSRPASRFGNET